MAGWVPQGVPGLRICLDAKSLALNHGDPVTAWPDNSEVSGDATPSVAANSTLDLQNDAQRPAVRVVKPSRFYLVDNTLAGLSGVNGAEVFGVLKSEFQTGRHGGPWYLWDSNYGSNYTWDGGFYDAAFTTIRDLSFNPGTITDKPHIINEYGKTNLKAIRFDGVVKASSTAAATFTAKATGAWIVSSKDYTNSIGQWQGWWYCFLVYDHVLTAAERDSVYRQIADRYLLTVTLDDGSTYVGVAGPTTVDAEMESVSASAGEAEAEVVAGTPALEAEAAAEGILEVSAEPEILTRVEPWEQCAPVPAPEQGEVRLDYADFATSTARLDGTSITRRPDAISLDYRTAHCVGPVARGDTSRGLLDRIWRARLTETNDVMISRANEANTAWEAEEFLFNAGPDEVAEIDLAFDQNAGVTVSVERTLPNGSSEVWMYWYDSAQQATVYESMGPGRTPRLILDDPQRVLVGGADLILFYLNDTLGRIEYRQQSDRFSVPAQAPMVTTADHYIEDVVRMQDRRVVVWMSVRDAVAGEYSMVGQATHPYPVVVEEGAEADFAGVLGGLMKVSAFHMQESAAAGFAGVLPGGRLSTLVVKQGLGDEEVAAAFVQILPGSVLKTTVVRSSLGDEWGEADFAAVLSGSMVVVVIKYTLGDESGQAAFAEVTGGTLVTV